MRFRPLLLLTTAAFLVIDAGRAQQEREPVFVGVRACASCHQGAGMGHQFSKWLLTKHSQAYAILSRPESSTIARLSGIPQIPQESAMCLGCHATAADTEMWERNEEFRIEDGVQCEKCHGPGSEYMEAEVMKNPEAAMAAGLKKPTKSDCLVCHFEKGSHVAVHKLPQLDIDQALIRIAHPSPSDPEYPESASEETENPLHSGPRYVGTGACSSCHRNASSGYQFSRWKLSAHARAWARLATPEAESIARAMGVDGDPQKSSGCLKCHLTGGADRERLAEQSFTPDEGVGCEACHGPGSEYQFEATMIDRPAAVAAGLTSKPGETCGSCHDGAHGKPFDQRAAWEKIKHPTEPVRIAKEVRYKTPLNLALSPRSNELFVACEASDSLVVIDLGTLRKTDEVKVGRQPHDVTLSPDGSRAWVTNRLGDSVSEIDVLTHTVLRTAPVGDEPHGVLTDQDGEHLFVLNTSEDSVSVLDIDTLTEIKRLSASRSPWSLALSPDGTRLLITNTLSRFVPFRTPSLSEVTAVETNRRIVTDRHVLKGANLLQGVAWHPGGEFALVTLNRTKNLVPMTRLLQGWTITNGLGIVWRDGRVDQVLLDEPNMCFPDPTDVAISPNGRLALVTSSGSDRVAAIDIEKLVSMLRSASESDRREVFPNHLGKPTEFVINHIPTGDSPRGVLFSADGTRAFVANALDDTLTIVDTKTLEVSGTVDLGGPEEITKTRFGEKVFHDARIAFQRQFSCHTCHPDGHVDGITYDIEPDGVGVSPVDNRTLRGILDTPPFKWEGTNPNLQRQCGPRLAVFFTRVAPFSPDELEAIELYIATIPRPPNRYRPLGAELTPAQRRGKGVFERTMTNDGRHIPVEGRCITCHPPPLYTNHAQTDVGTRMQYDRESVFDVPHLNNIYDSAPYLHNGAAPTLEEIWTRFNPEDKHGVTNDMTKDQLNDLIEYIKTF